MRVTKKEIETKVKQIVHRTCKGIVLHSQSNMPGTMYRLETKEGGRDLSPLLPPKEMTVFLSGWMRALDELSYNAQDEIILRKHSGFTAEGHECAKEVIGVLFCPCPYCNEAREERRRLDVRTKK